MLLGPGGGTGYLGLEAEQVTWTWRRSRLLRSEGRTGVLDLETKGLGLEVEQVT